MTSLYPENVKNMYFLWPCVFDIVNMNKETVLPFIWPGYLYGSKKLNISLNTLNTLKSGIIFAVRP